MEILSETMCDVAVIVNRQQRLRDCNSAVGMAVSESTGAVTIPRDSHAQRTGCGTLLHPVAFANLMHISVRIAQVNAQMR